MNWRKLALVLLAPLVMAQGGQPGGGGVGADAVQIDGVDANNPDFRSEGDVDFIRCTGVGTPDASCLAAEDVIARFISAGLEMKEVDGTPTIPGVGRIVVTNATLTDDGVVTGKRQATLLTGAGGGAAGTQVSVDGGSPLADADLRDEGDINSIRCTGAGAPDSACVATNDVIFRVKTDSVALGTDTTGNYAASNAEGGPATDVNLIIEGTTRNDPNFASELDIDWVYCTGPGAPESVCVQAGDVIQKVKADSVQLGTDTTGNYAGSTSEGGPASSVAANSVALGTDTTGGYAGSATEGGSPNSFANNSITLGTHTVGGYAGSATEGGSPNSFANDSITLGTHTTGGYAGSATEAGSATTALDISGTIQPSRVKHLTSSSKCARFDGTGLLVSANQDCASVAAQVDNDQDGLYEYALLWDADGDGSPIAALCTAKENPYPQCKKSGELVTPDGADDINCAIHGCGFGRMSPTGTLLLPNGVVVIFPCWDVGAWDNDASTPGACPATGINDPRGSCQPNGDTGTALRYDSVSGDAAVYASCPVDNDGYKMMAVAFQDWQGTIVGRGVDPRDLPTTGTPKRDVGTTLAVDTSNFDLAYFDPAGAGYRSITFGRWLGDFSPPLLQFANGGSAITGDSKGWGRIRLLAGSPSWLTAQLPGGWARVCVCNSATACDSPDVGAGWASATNWTDNIVDGDILSTRVLLTANTTVNAAVDVIARGGGSDWNQGSCGASNVEQISLGGLALSGLSGRSAGFWFGGLAPTSFVGIIVHTRSSYRQNRTTMKNLTIEPQDYYNEAGGDCTRTGTFVVGQEGSPRDNDCDTKLLTGYMGGGENFTENVVVKHWHSFPINGDSHSGKSKFRDMQFWFGQGAAFTDDSFGWEWTRTLVSNSIFTDAMFGGFFSHTNYSDLDVRNSECSNCLKFISSSQNMTIKNLRFRGVQAASLVQFNCGAKNNVIDGLEVYGRRIGNESGGNTIHMACDAPYSNDATSGFCDEVGYITDRDGSSSPNRWCDNRISGNTIRNVAEYPMGPDLLGRNNITAVGSNRFTLSNPNNFYHCQGPLFLSLGSGPLTCSGCGSHVYVINPDATSVQVSTSSACTTAATLGGSVAGTPHLRISGSDQSSFGYSDVAAASRVVYLDVANGQEEAISGNVFDRISWNPPDSNKLCVGNGTQCELDWPLSHLFVAAYQAEEVFLYNTISNSLTNGGSLLSVCQADASGIDCPDAGPMQSYVKPLGSGNMDSVISRAWHNGGNDMEVRFCGDLPSSASTAYFGPNSPQVTSAFSDPRNDRAWTAKGCSTSATDSPTDETVANDAVIPTTSALQLSAVAMTCRATGDVAGNVTFQLREDISDVTGAACTITATSGFDSYCSVAVPVAQGNEPVLDTAGSLWAVAVTTAGNESANDAYCDVIFDTY